MNRSGICHSTDNSPSVNAPQALGEEADSKIEVKSLDELTILGELGSGASGTVRKALHKPTGTLLAVKSITILEKAKRDQMKSELKIMRTHELSPWLIQMYNAFYEDSKVEIVLEYMDMGSVEALAKLHPDGLRDERELTKIARQILYGLQFLHKHHHQVHRDLKPANVLLSKHGQVKISDFGISSQLDSTNAFCSTFVGTACYMAPERLSGGSYSYASDIWSFGLILLELIIGRYPYDKSDNYFKLLSNIMNEQAPSVPEGDFSDDLAEFVNLCLDKDPMRRPTATDLLKHHWLRQSPADDFLLSGLMEQMAL